MKSDQLRISSEESMVSSKDELSDSSEILFTGTKFRSKHK